MDYKKLIKSQERRIKILKLLSFIPDKGMVFMQYYLKFGRVLNIKNPQRFTEKIQWYKLYYKNPLMTKCADKLLVREYVAEKGYSEILIPLIGSYSDVDQIPFAELPSEFVLKTTNGSHTNIICRDKSKLDITRTKETLKHWLDERPVNLGREWAYYNIKPSIVCEKYMYEKGNKETPIKDFKFICFNGNVKLIWVDIDRGVNHRRDFYDVNWVKQKISVEHPNSDSIMQLPEQFERMKQIAEKLSTGFPHVRVDLYNIDGKIYFGELTFYSHSGYYPWSPDCIDFQLGEEFRINKEDRTCFQ